jgi:hypothetical protein
VQAPAINRAVIAGLIDDRPRRRLVDGRLRVSVTVVIIRRRRDANGLRKTYKTRLVVECWEEVAQQILTLSLNQPVLVRGRMTVRGGDRQRLVVVADEMSTA